MTPEEMRADWAAYWSRYVKVDAKYLADKAGDMLKDATRAPDLFTTESISFLRDAVGRLNTTLAMLED